jgi:hypothetical protein
LGPTWNLAARQNFPAVPHAKPKSEATQYTKGYPAKLMYNAPEDRLLDAINGKTHH